MISLLSDAVSSAGLLLAALALVFNAWASSIDEALNKTFSPNEAEKIREKSAITMICNRRAKPLAIGSWLIVAVFIPRDIVILTATMSCLATGGNECGYDEVAAIFLLTQMVFAFLAWHVSSQVRELTKKAA